MSVGDSSPQEFLRKSGNWRFIAVVVIIGLTLVGFLVYSTYHNNVCGPAGCGSESGQTTMSKEGSTTTSARVPAVNGTDCISVIPYDSIGKQFAGCGYTFSVLYNGDDYTQITNGTETMNLGFTLLIGGSQDCRCGPSENVTFGWDPAGPSTTSGERLPGPPSSTLFDGNLTIQWRLYDSPAPRLYAWLIAYSFASSQQTISSESSSACATAPWPSQVSTSYQPAVQQIEQDPAYLALANKLCYSFTQNEYGESQGQSLTTFIFNQYNGTVFYPCGTFPANFTTSQIQVTVFNGTTTVISSMWLDNETASLNVYSCPLATTPVWVHSVSIVPPYTPAGPTVEVTLRANLGQKPITNLTAVLGLTGREQSQSQTQTFRFVNFSASNPLLAGQLAFQTETIVGPVTIYPNHLYSMNISGTFQNGQAFSYDVQVEIVSGPSSGNGSASTSATSEA